jgi:hypothetical protein
MRILVVGAGWYGCHLACALIDQGYDVVVAERRDRILDCASGNNQFRLHMGFHYPRSYVTRMQTIDGYHKFMAQYGDYCLDIRNNIYGVSSEGSYIDFGTFQQIMRASNIPFETVDPMDFELLNVTGAVRCAEKVILTDPARKFFENRLGPRLRKGHAVRHIESLNSCVVVDGEVFDWVINATWFGFQPPRRLRFWYEPTILFYYKSVDPGLAITIMDGDFCSIYPSGPETVTLSSVPLTPRGRFEDRTVAEHYIQGLTKTDLDDIRWNMERQAVHFLPSFADRFEFLDVQRSVKSKVPDSTDSRVCQVHQDNRQIWIFSGKIDTIFHAETQVLELIRMDRRESCARQAS